MGSLTPDVKTWLHKVNLAIESACESRSPIIIANVGQALDGDAAAWFRGVCESNLCTPATTTWSELQAALVQRFAPIDERQLAISWFMDVNRGSAGTSVESINLFVSTLLSKAAILRGHLSDLFAIAFLRRALPQNIKNIATQLLLSPNTSLEATSGVALGLARTLAQEGFLQSSNPSSLPPPAPVFTSTSYASTSGPVPMDLAALRIPSQQQQQVQQKAPPGVPHCNYCHKDGHWARDPVTGTPVCHQMIKKLAGKQ